MGVVRRERKSRSSGIAGRWGVPIAGGSAEGREWSGSRIMIISKHGKGGGNEHTGGNWGGGWWAGRGTRCG